MDVLAEGMQMHQTRISNGFSRFERDTDHIRQGNYRIFVVMQIDSFSLTRSTNAGEEEWML